MMRQKERSPRKHREDEGKLHKASWHYCHHHDYSRCKNGSNIRVYEMNEAIRRVEVGRYNVVFMQTRTISWITHARKVLRRTRRDKPMKYTKASDTTAQLKRE